MKKKWIIIFISILIIGLLLGISYHFITNSENVIINSDENYIATIYYDYELGIDASRGYNVFIYKDLNNYKYEIKYGEITEGGPTKMKTKGYGRVSSIKDIEKLNNAFKNKQYTNEKFSIKYRIINEDGKFEYCDLNKFKDYLFKQQ